MKELKLLLACSMFFGLSLGMTACDVEDDEEDCEVGPCGDTGAGGVGGMGGEGGVGGGDPLEYRYVIIGDDNGEENLAGTAGADICSVVANCGADDLLGTSARVTLGDGTVCDGTTMDAPCESGTNRGNANAALQVEDMCEGGSSPSHYVSLGLAGELAIEFIVDLTECNVVVNELEGPQNEPYSVYICATDTLDIDTCLNMGDPVQTSPAAGGPVSFEVPAAE